ncbi:hypothetical protein ACVW00_002121 [Marmoricola sp. URHA0025 HA25]
MSRARLATLGAVLLLSLQACGGGSDKGYCDALKADQPLFAQMQDDTSGLGLLKHRAALHALADKAPDDLGDEWQTFLGALDAFAGTLSDLHVAPGDFVDGKPPAGLGEDARNRIASAASELSSADVVEAADGIEQHAKDVCKLQLGL